MNTASATHIRTHRHDAYTRALDLTPRSSHAVPHSGAREASPFSWSQSAFVARGCFLAAVVYLSTTVATFAQQVQPLTRTELGQFTSGLLVLLMALVAILQVASFFRRKPSIEAEFATKTELNSLRAELTDELGALRMQIRTDYEAVQRSGEARVSGLHNRINDVLAGVSSAKTGVDALALQVRQLMSRALGGAAHES